MKIESDSAGAAIVGILALLVVVVLGRETEKVPWNKPNPKNRRYR
jgi:hypothetical protein